MTSDMTHELTPEPTSAAVASAPLSRGRALTGWYFRFACVLALIALADWLLYGYWPGISMPLFIIALAACSALLAIRAGNLNNGRKAIIILVVSIIPAVETFNPLTALIALFGLITIVLLIRSKEPLRLNDLAVSLLYLLCVVPGKLLFDLFRFNRIFNPLRRAAFARKTLITWAIPVIFSIVFLGLFTFANPVIELWLAQIELPDLSNGVDVFRLLFWMVCAAGIWPFLTPIIKRWKSRLVQPSSGPGLSVEGVAVFGSGPVFRALLMFNGLFALQTALDIIYLWGLGALPEGITYSQYVHNGTYALLAAALLSILFILIVTGDRRGQHHLTKIRLLLLIWVAQNSFLVISTMKRMHMYIDAYALTYLRIAALVWMLLVLAGLILIAVRLLWKRNNAWLVRMNLASLALVLYGVSLVNMPGFIASYNVDNAMNNPRVHLDIYYLRNLGPQAIPAIDKATDPQHWIFLENYTRVLTMKGYRKTLADGVLAQHRQWRAWTFRQQRLINYLNTKAL